MMGAMVPFFPQLALLLGLAAPAVSVPIIHTTDLFDPPVDPDDYFDLATVFAFPEFDIRAVIFDDDGKFAVGPFPKDQPPRRPGFEPLQKLAAVFDRRPPPAAAGPMDPFPAPVTRTQPGIELFLRALRESPSPAVVTVVGSARIVAAAFALEPRLLKERIRVVLLNAGSSDDLPELEWNVSLDPRAYAVLLRSGVPIDWYPCAGQGPPKGGPFAYGPRNTFWKASQAELLQDLPQPLLEWFFAAFPGKTRDQILGMNRNMWSTASLALAAGRVLVSTSSGWRFRAAAGGAETELLALDPVSVEATPDGRTTWKPAARSHIRLFRRNPTPGHEAAMREALNALLSGR